MRRELRFLVALWKANLLAAMEFRAAFITQVVGMMVNNAIYFLFWVIFFDRFRQVRGWALSDMFLLFGIAATSYGLAVYFFGNVLSLSEVIANGRLDYYLSLPRPVLLHVLASRSVASGLGDTTYGILSVLVARPSSPEALPRYILGILLGTTVLLCFLIVVQSLAFWLGNTSMLAQQATNAMLTFTIYPITIFDGTAKFLLFTIVPAAFVGAIPAELVRSFSWAILVQLLAAALVLLTLALFIFHRGLRRYESGSAIQIQV